MTAHSTHRSHRRGFTLIELVVSLAILSIILVSLAAITGDVSARWQSAFARVNNFSKARVSLDVIGGDLARALIVPDLAAFPTPTAGGNSQLRAITQTSGGGDRPLSLVEYHVVDPAQAGDPTELGLWRESVPIGYTDPLPYFQNALEFAQFSGTPQDDQLGPGILLFRCQFVQNDGTLRDDFVYDFEDATAPTSCRLVVVTLLVVDENALSQLEDAGKTNPFISHFSANPSPTQRFREYWMSLRDDASFMATMPRAVRSGVEIYERSYPLNASL